MPCHCRRGQWNLAFAYGVVQTCGLGEAQWYVAVALLYSRALKPALITVQGHSWRIFDDSQYVVCLYATIRLFISL